VDSALNGVNGTIMAYGQTGAGKSFTMIGDTSNFKHRGIIPRSLSKIFEAVEERAETKFEITCSYVEIYNERFFDLLEDVSSQEERSYSIVEEKGGIGTFVRGLRREVVRSEEDALNLLFEGELQRTTAKHLLNKRSNRSHCILTVYIKQTSSLRGSATRFSKLNLVDLAGSERLKKTMGETGSTLSDATTMRESNFINKSLSYLEQCVVALTSKSRNHIPYRQTKLTNVLKDSLGGNAKTVMIACIWAESRHVDETISTLSLSLSLSLYLSLSLSSQHTHVQHRVVSQNRYTRTCEPHETCSKSCSRERNNGRTCTFEKVRTTNQGTQDRTHDAQRSFGTF